MGISHQGDQSHDDWIDYLGLDAQGKSDGLHDLQCQGDLTGRLAMLNLLCETNTGWQETSVYFTI